MRKLKYLVGRGVVGWGGVGGSWLEDPEGLCGGGS
jgi:hypothetical protein